MTSVFRAPNVEGSAKDKVQAELDILLEEFAYSPGFKLFLNEIVTPIVVETRGKLLRFQDISESERLRLVARLDMLERILEDLYSRTADASVPEALKNFFR